MEDESFEDEAIAQLMNDNFINIKVIAKSVQTWTRFI